MLTRYANKVRAETVNRIVVGYSAPYAVYQHENLEYHHEVGQAKYLEEPARVHRKRIARIVADARRSGIPLDQALRKGGEELKRLSQALVPVDTGFLRDSAFVEVRRA